MISLLTCLIVAVSWSTPLPSPGGKGPVCLPGGRVLLNWSGKGKGARLACYATDNLGKTWKDIGTIAEDLDQRTDLGDGNLVRDAKGHLYTVYRRNHYFGEPKDYAIEVAESRDNGVTWKPHSVVTTAKRGLWAPFLLLTKSGELQCYYDDEDTPAQHGLLGHQWITRKVYSLREKRWGNPLTVAREEDPKQLSRDGMACVVETAPEQLLCVIEGVQTKPPHSGVLRSVISRDGGKSWTDRHLVYAPKDPRFHAFSPWLVKTKKAILLAFSTNEDRETSPPSGTPAHQMMLDIKTLISMDQGKTWSKPELLYGGTHRNYLPSMVTLPDGQIFATWIDFDRSCLTSVGTLPQLERSSSQAHPRATRAPTRLFGDAGDSQLLRLLDDPLALLHNHGLEVRTQLPLVERLPSNPRFLSDRLASHQILRHPNLFCAQHDCDRIEKWEISSIGAPPG